MSGCQSVFKRKETKYVISDKEMEELLSLIEDNLVPDYYFESDITSTYYDTPGYEIIEHSLSKPKFKEKLRVRTYGKDTVFVELKKKFNGIVYKRRIEMTPAAAKAWMSGEMGFADAVEAYGSPEEYGYRPRQISREVDAYVASYDELSPSMEIHARRFSYHGKDDATMRITFDTEIGYVDLRGGDGQLTSLIDGIVMEIKVADAYPMWLVDALSKLRIYPTSFSKYGNAYRKVCPKPASGNVRTDKGQIVKTEKPCEPAARKLFAAISRMLPKGIVLRPRKAAVLAKEA